MFSNSLKDWSLCFPLFPSSDWQLAINESELNKVANFLPANFQLKKIHEENYEWYLEWPFCADWTHYIVSMSSETHLGPDKEIIVFITTSIQPIDRTWFEKCTSCFLHQSLKKYFHLQNTSGAHTALDGCRYGVYF